MCISADFVFIIIRVGHSVDEAVYIDEVCVEIQGYLLDQMRSVHDTVARVGHGKQVIFQGTGKDDATLAGVLRSRNRTWSKHHIRCRKCEPNCRCL